MASLKEALKKGISTEKKEEASEPAINEFIEKVFCTRTLVHFEHWKTGSYAAHNALGDLYDAIVEEVDNLVETYQGEFGLLSGLECCECKPVDDIIAQIESDASWMRSNRDKIANGSPTIQNLIDGVDGAYRKAIYKLRHLK